MTFQEFLFALVQHPVAIRPGESWEASMDAEPGVTFCGGIYVRFAAGQVVVASRSWDFETRMFTDATKALDCIHDMCDAAAEAEESLRD